jgi:protein-S-isoprenylcysteine O-methyltransferase Ste14
MSPRVWVITLLPLLAIVYLTVQFRPQYFGPMEITGTVLAVMGLGLLTVARFQLGDSFSVTPQARHLVTNGLYSRIRNPVYVFSAIGLSGVALYVHRPMYLLGLLVLIPAQVARARAEERVLKEKFGEEYTRYKATTWF